MLVLTAYCASGVVFGTYFVTYGVNRLDPAARSAGWGFRLLILPGVIALWPWLFWRSCR